MAKTPPNKNEDDIAAKPAIVKKKGLSNQTKLVIGASAFVLLLITSTVIIVMLIMSPVSDPAPATDATNPDAAAGAAPANEAAKTDKTDAPSNAEKTAEPAKSEPPKAAEPKKEEAESSGAESDEKDDKEASTRAQYYTIKPPFIITFQYKGRMHFLQISVDVMAHSEKLLTAVDKNLPLIKNNLISLFSEEDFEKLQMPAEREALRIRSLSVVQKVLDEQGGDGTIDQVLFTSFVMQ